MDSGNSFGSCISEDFARLLNISDARIRQSMSDPSEISTAQVGKGLPVLGRLTTPITVYFGGQNHGIKFRPYVLRGLSMPINISADFMETHRIDILHSQKAVRVKGKTIPLKDPTTKDQISALEKVEWDSFKAYVAEDTPIPAHSARFIRLRVPEGETGELPACDVLVEAQAHFIERTDLHPSLSVITHLDENGSCYVSALNTLAEEVLVPSGLRFGEVRRFRDSATDPRDWRVASIQGETQDRPVSRGAKSKKWIYEEFRLHESPFLTNRVYLEAAMKLLRDFEDLFSEGDEYGHTDLVQHEIRTQDVPPIKCKLRPLAPPVEEKLKEQMDHWLKQDVVEPSTSPWSFALIAVPKKNGKTRFCVDYRRLNEVTLKDSFPLPHIEDSLARLSRSTVFSGIDGTGAYHVVSVREEDREKTAFATPWGLYQFKRMPFGLCNAPATYCRLVARVLEGIPSSVAIPYLDDTCVHSATFPEHLHNLRRVLEAHRKAGLTLQPSKCQLFRDEIEFLGHVVNRHGISVPGRYTEIIRNWPEPTTVSDLRTFLGKLGYYRRFIRNYSARTSVLTQYTSKDADVGSDGSLQLSLSALVAFQRLKAALTKAPILAYPRFDSPEPFIVDTDWSGDAVGGVLSQVQDGAERVIAYGSNTLNKTQRNYSSNKGELLAVVHFLKQWKYYLQHRRFVLRTDHEALKWIHRMEEPKGMILRWLEVLASYDFEVQFRKGNKHANADALSRINHGEPIDDPDLDDDSINWDRKQALPLLPAPEAPEHENPANPFQTAPILSIAAMEGPTIAPSLADLLQAQWDDEELMKVHDWVDSGVWPDDNELKGFSRTLKQYAMMRPHLYKDEQGLLRRGGSVRGVERDRICLPQQYTEAITKQCHHETGHRGITSTAEQVGRRFYFPHLISTAGLVVATCVTCQKAQPDARLQKHTYMSFPEGYPWQRISIDFVGPLVTSSKGNQYILTVKDCFSRWIEAFPTNNMRAKTVAELLVGEVFCRYGMPEVVHSDNGAQFTSEEMKAVYDELAIRPTTTPAYNPKSNPVERSHKDLGRLLRACTVDGPDEWESYLPHCLFALRVAKNRSTGLSPHEILFGRDCTIPLDILYGSPKDEHLPPHLYAKHMRDRMIQVHKTVRQQIDSTIQRTRHQFTNRLQGRPLAENDLVWLFTPRGLSQTGKKLRQWWTGPWRILRVLSPVLFEIVPEGDWNAHRLVKPVVGIDRLRRYTCQDTHEPGEDSITADEIEELDEFFEGAPTLDPPLDDDDEEPPPLAGVRPLMGGGAPGPPEPPAPPAPPPPPDVPIINEGVPHEDTPAPHEQPLPRTADVSMEDPPEPDHEMAESEGAQSRHSDGLALEWDDMDFRDPGVDQVEEDLAGFHEAGPAMLMRDEDDPILREVIELERTLDQFDRNLALLDDHYAEVPLPRHRSSPEIRIEVPPSSPDTTPLAIPSPEDRQLPELLAPNPVIPLPPPPDYPALTYHQESAHRKGPPRRPAPRAALPPPAVTRSQASREDHRLPVTVTLGAEAHIEDRILDTPVLQGPVTGSNAPPVPPPLSSQELRAQLLGPRSRNNTKRASSRDVSFQSELPPFGKRSIVEVPRTVPTSGNEGMGIAPASDSPGEIERSMGNAPAAEVSTKSRPASPPRLRRNDSDSYSDAEEALDELAPLNSTLASRRDKEETSDRRTRRQRRENLLESLRSRNEAAAERHAIPSTQELLRTRNQRRAREFLRMQNEIEMENDAPSDASVADRSRSFYGARPKKP